MVSITYGMISPAVRVGHHGTATTLSDARSAAPNRTVTIPPAGRDDPYTAPNCVGHDTIEKQERTPMSATSSSLTRPWRGATILVGVVLLGTVLAACGSSNKAATTTTTSSASSATTGATTPAGSSSLSKIEALTSSVQSSETATFKAVYTITTA